MKHRHVCVSRGEHRPQERAARVSLSAGLVPALFPGRFCPSVGLHSDAPPPGPAPAERSCPATASSRVRTGGECHYRNVFL